MRLLGVIAVVAAAYTYFLLHTTDKVMNQTVRLNTAYQYAANHADQLATGRSLAAN